MTESAHLPRRAPLYALTIALLPAAAVFGEFAFNGRGWHPLAQVALVYLLFAVVWHAGRELRFALAHEGSDTPANAADLLLLALFMLAQFALHPLLTRLGAWGLTPTLGLDPNLLYYALSLLLWIALFLYARRIPGNRYDFNLPWRWKPVDLLILAAVGSVTWTVLSWYLATLGDLHPPMQIFGIAREGSPAWLYIGAGILFTTANAVTEELWFRGILLEALRPLLPAASCILLQALVFGIVHWFGTPRGILGFVLAGAWAIALGWWTYTRRSLWQALAVHLLADWLIFAYTNS